MAIIFAHSTREKAKIKAVGSTLNLLTLLVSISKLLAEKVAIEKNISMSEAEKFIMECVSDGMKTIDN